MRNDAGNQSTHFTSTDENSFPAGADGKELTAVSLLQSKLQGSGTMEIYLIPIGTSQSDDPPLLSNALELKISYSEANARPPKRLPPQVPVEQGEAKQPQPYTWTTPDEWKEIPATEMREVNLRFGPNDEGECYVMRTLGVVGDIMWNVKRWRKQMGAADLTEEEIMNLPKKRLFGQPATFVSVDGAYSSVGAEAKPDYRLCGLILSISDTMVFVKMTGPRQLLLENEVEFDAFCVSLALKTGTQ